MPQPVDLTNLREITDGDTEMEAELFAEFITSSDAYIRNLSEMVQDNQSEEWRSIAHAFKGLALNLGAEHLGELCKAAQENHTATHQEKATMLASIQEEYHVVRGYILNLTNH